MITGSEIESVILENSLQAKVQVWMASLGNFTKYTKKKIYISSSCTILKDWKEGNTPKDILRSYQHPHIKSGKDTTKKKKERNKRKRKLLKANIPN